MKTGSLNQRYKVTSRDDYGNNLMAQYHLYDMAGFSPRYDDERYYHDPATLSNFVRRAWNGDAQAWVPSVDYHYNENGDFINGENKVWSFVSNFYTGGFKGYAFYDSNGWIQQDSFYSWDANISDWVPWFITSYEVDEEGNTIQRTQQEWDEGTGSWVNDFRWFNTYDNNLLTEELIEMWDEVIQDWVPDYRRLYSYNVDQLQDTVIRRNWNADIDSWELDDRQTYTYDNQLETFYLLETWDDDNQSWTQSRKTEREYDANGNLLEIARYDWNPTATEWIGTTRILYDYDMYDNQIERISQFWNFSVMDWENNSRREHFYSEVDVMTGVDQVVPALDIQVTPNPSTGLFEIQSNKANTYDITTLTGQVLLRGDLPAGRSSIDLSAFPKGLYFLRLAVGETVKLMKL